MSRDEEQTANSAPPVIPVLRLNDDDDNVNQLVKNLRDACTNVGFFYLEDHGIDDSLMEQVLEHSHKLFRLPEEEKRALSDKVTSRGYTAMEEETLDPARQTRGDTKEGYYIGREVSVDSDEYNPAKLAVPNIWPSSLDDSDLFQSTMTLYLQECMRVGFRLQQLLALAIGLQDEHYWDEAFLKPLAILRLLHYAPQPSSPQDGIYACGAHSDYGMLTLLLTDDVGGLQIQTSSKEWLDVPPRKHAFVVNLGDMLERWTNGVFVSTVHRVLTNAAGDAQERYSVPFFYEPNFDTHVKCLDICCSEENPAKYPPTTSGQHLLDKYKQTHADFEPDDKDDNNKDEQEA